MMGRRFMDGANLWERQPFVSLGQETPVVVAPTPVVVPGPVVVPPAVVSPAPVVVTPAPSGYRVGTVLAGAAALFFASEVVGLTNVLGIRKYVRR